MEWELFLTLDVNSAGEAFANNFQAGSVYLWSESGPLLGGQGHVLCAHVLELVLFIERLASRAKLVERHNTALDL